MTKMEVPERTTDNRINNTLARTNDMNTSVMTTEKGDGVKFAPPEKQLEKCLCT